MLREYETIYILRPDISDSDADRITNRVRTAIRENEGLVLEVKNWGKKRLAYEVSHNQKGIYLYWRFAGNSKAVGELERNLRMLEPVLRFLTVKLSDTIDKESVLDIGDDAIPLRATRRFSGDERPGVGRPSLDDSDDDVDLDDDDIDDLDDDDL